MNLLFEVTKYSQYSFKAHDKWVWFCQLSENLFKLAMAGLVILGFLPSQLVYYVWPLSTI